MRAIVHQAPCSAGDLSLQDVPMPSITPTQLLVKVAATGVNRADIVQRQGRYPAPAGASPLLGLEIAGEVIAVGDAVTDFAIGDAVLGLIGGGGYAEYAVLDTACAIHKPAELSWQEAASLPEAWMTAWLNLCELGQLQAGETVLIHAGASGVGSAAIQLAKWRGAKVITTVGNAEKAAWCRELGADIAIVYSEQDFASVVREQGRVALILDCIGGSYLQRNLQCLATDGRLIVIGVMGGAKAELDLAMLLVKRIRLLGSTLRSQGLPQKQQLTQALREHILPAILRGALRPTIDCCFALADAAAAHRYLEENRNLGKVLLNP